MNKISSVAQKKRKDQNKKKEQLLPIGLSYHDCYYDIMMFLFYILYLFKTLAKDDGDIF